MVPWEFHGYPCKVPISVGTNNLVGIHHQCVLGLWALVEIFVVPLFLVLFPWWHGWDSAKSRIGSYQAANSRITSPTLGDG